MNSKAYLVQLIRRIPYLLLIAVTGAILGSGLYLIIMLFNTRTTMYESVNWYYVDFEDSRIDAKDYYNAYTWNTVLGTDEILGVMMTQLGDEYDRDVIKSMMKGEILSDVKYLCVTITGENPDKIEKIKNELTKALEAFGKTKKEFDQIYQIEDGKVTKISVPFFTWRAAVLGAIVFLIIGIFIESVRFGVGSRFYTITDIGAKARLISYGIEFADSKNTESNDIEKKKLIRNLENLGYTCEEVMRVPLDYDFANKGYDELRQYKGILIDIPFGKDCIGQVEEVLNNLKIQNITVIGGVLVNVDRTWHKMYMFGI